MSRTTRTERSAQPADRRCPNCLKPATAVHFSANGTTQCQHGNRFWRLSELTERGWSDVRIAATLAAQWDRPMTGRAVRVARSRHGQPGHRSIALSVTTGCRRICGTASATSCGR